MIDQLLRKRSRSSYEELEATLATPVASPASIISPTPFITPILIIAPAPIYSPALAAATLVSSRRRGNSLKRKTLGPLYAVPATTAGEKAVVPVVDPAVVPADKSVLFSVVIVIGRICRGNAGGAKEKSCRNIELNFGQRQVGAPG